MHHARTAAVAIATAVLSLGATPVVAHATGAGDEACAKQQQQVDKAQDALERLNEVFAKQKTKVERLQEQLEAATTDEEKERIQAKLDKALAKKQHVRKDKKAQQQRLAKAEERLAECQAEQSAA